MPRVLLTAASLLLLSGSIQAGELKGTVKKVDVGTRTLVVTDEKGDQQTFTVSRDAEVYRQGPARQNKPGPKQLLSDGLAGVSVGNEVTLMTFKSGDRNIVTAVKVEPARRKK